MAARKLTKRDVDRFEIAANDERPYTAEIRRCHMVYSFMPLAKVMWLIEREAEHAAGMYAAAFRLTAK